MNYVANTSKADYRKLLMGAVSTLSLALMVPYASAQSSSETTPPPITTSTNGDEIIVTGIRHSLKNALDEKRNSKNIVDGISAEDIGKSSDQNIADALSRVTGVSIERSEGEGSTVTVRGIDANLNNVTINGVTVTNAAGDVRNFDAGQAVDFSAFSSDLLSRIEVAKTSSADHNEGSLGATILLKTFRPLEVKKDRRVIDVQGRFSEFASDELKDYRVNLALSDKFANDTIGLSVVATTEQTSGRRDEVNINRWEPKSFGTSVGNPVDVTDVQALTNGVQDLPGGITNLQTGETEFTGADEVNFLRPHQVTYEQTNFQNKRKNITGTVQWRPDDTTDIKVDATYTTLDRLREGSSFRVRTFGNRPTYDGPLSADGVGNAYDPTNSSQYNYRLSAYRNAGNPIPGNANNIGFIRPAALLDDNTETTFVLGFDAKKVVGDFTLNLSGGRSESKFKNNDFIFSQAQILNGGAGAAEPTFFGNGLRPGLTMGYDCERDGSLCSIFVDDTVPNRTAGGALDGLVNPDLAIVDDAGELIFGAIGGRDQEINDVNKSLFLDVDWDKSFGSVSSFEFGGKYDDRQRTQQGTFNSIGRFILDPNAPAGTTGRARFIDEFLELPISGFVDPAGGLQDNFGERLGLDRDNITDGVVFYDPVALRSHLQEQAPDAGRTRPALANFRDVGITSYGAYAKANYELKDGRVYGDVGVRWVKTEVDSRGGATINPSLGQFTNEVDSLATFGYIGAGDPGNTATLAEAQAALTALFGPDLLLVGAPGFVEPAGSSAVASNSYDNWLPSFNLNWLAKEDLLLRFAVSKTMARPNIDRLRPNLTVNENPFQVSNASAGNPFLKPFRSTNFDVSAEWYFDDESLFSVAVFNKKLADSERQVTQFLYVRDPRLDLYDANGAAINDPNTVVDQNTFLLPFTPSNQPIDTCLPVREFDLASTDITRQCAPIQFARPINAGDAYVRGVEVSLQHNFADKPGLLGGMGFSANYTYADSEVKKQVIDDGFGGEQVFRAAPLPNTSNHTVNGTLYYDKDDVQLRAAYNYRSDYLRSTAALAGGTRVYVDGGATFDLSGGYDITDNLSINFQAVNLLDTKRRSYAVVEAANGTIQEEALTLGDQPQNRFQSLSNTGRIFRVGARYNF